MKVGISAFGTCLGERELSRAELCTELETSEEVLAKAIGTGRVYASAHAAETLGAEAARRCLARAGITPKDIDVIIWSSGIRGSQYAHLRVQHELGASQAISFIAGMSCSEFMSALQWARAMLRDEEHVRRVLVVSGQRFLARANEVLTDIATQPVFCDGGGAALIERSARYELLGFGSASAAHLWNYYDRRRDVLEGRPDAAALTPLQLAYEAIRLYRTALQRCLENTGVRLDEIDHVMLPQDGPPIIDFYVRHLGLDPKKVVPIGDGPTHVGASDMVFGLERLERLGTTRPEGLVLFGDWTFNAARFGVLRIGEAGPR